MPVLARLAALSFCFQLFSFPSETFAQRTFRESFMPYNLICDTSGEVGTYRYVLHIEDTTWKLINLPTIKIGSQDLTVDEFDANVVKAYIDGNFPEHPEYIKSVYIEIDRNTGELKVTYRETTQVTSNGLKFWFTHSSHGLCSKRAQAF